MSVKRIIRKTLLKYKKLIKRFVSTYKFCDGDINKFILLLRKGAYPHEYMDIWERFYEKLLPNTEAFYSSLNMEDITDVIIDMQKEYLKTLIRILEISALEYMSLILVMFFLQLL